MNLDETDFKILRILLTDARLSSRQIAKKVGVSVGTTISRMKKMEHEKVIKGYSVTLDSEKLGYELTAIIEVTVSKGKLLETAKEIAMIPNVCAVYDVTGLTDTVVLAKFKNRRGLSKFVKSMLSMPFVERTNTHLVLTTVKEDHRII